MGGVEKTLPFDGQACRDHIVAQLLADSGNLPNTVHQFGIYSCAGKGRVHQRNLHATVRLAQFFYIGSSRGRDNVLGAYVGALHCIQNHCHVTDRSTDRQFA